MFENSTCIISRKKVTSDVHYYLPWLYKDPGSNNVFIEEEYKQQLEFLVAEEGRNKWKLVAFDGNIKKNIFNATNENYNDIVQYKRNPEGLLCEFGHKIQIDELINGLFK